MVVTAVQFAHSEVRAAAALPATSDAGDLTHVLVFAEGMRVNGDAIVAGLSAALPDSVRVTGGLAGDDERFGTTVVALGGPPAGAAAVAIGFYGDRFAVGAGALGGWDVFGPARVVTRAGGRR